MLNWRNIFNRKINFFLPPNIRQYPTTLSLSRSTWVFGGCLKGFWGCWWSWFCDYIIFRSGNIPPFRVSCPTRFFGGLGWWWGVSKRALIRNPACIFTRGQAGSRRRSSWMGRARSCGVEVGKKQSPTEELGKVPPSIFISDPNA